MQSAWLGSLGATFAALCCAGVPVILGALSAAGLGVLINDAILLPLGLLSLGVALWALGRGTARHGLGAVLALGSLGAVLLMVGIFLSPPVVYAGVATMLGAALWNTVALGRAHR